MCMMLIKPVNYSLPQNYLDSLWSRNSHGFGAYCFKTKTVFKTLDKDEAQAYLTKHHKKELFIHFRMATGGQKTLDNVHPFNTGHDLLLFHNGIMRTTNASGSMSDTAQYALYWRNQLLDSASVDGTATTPRDEHLNAIMSDLELNEGGSRFTIIDQKSNEVYYPSCAKWVEHTTKCGTLLTFSNSYAISSKILNGEHDYVDVGYDYLSDYDWTFDDKYSQNEQYEEALVISELQRLIDTGASHAKVTEFIEQEAFYLASWLMSNVMTTNNTQTLTMLNDDTPSDDDNCMLDQVGVA